MRIYYTAFVDDIAIKQATKEDIPAIADLATKTFIETWGHTFTPEKLKQRIQETRSVNFYNQIFDKTTIFLAIKNSELIGYVQFGDLSFDWDGVTKEDQELQRLYILSKYQEKGLGKTLLEKALSHPRLKQARNIYLDVWKNNPRAKKLYELYGFKEIGTFGNEIIMIKKSKYQEQEK